MLAYIVVKPNIKSLTAEKRNTEGVGVLTLASWGEHEAKIIPLIKQVNQPSKLEYKTDNINSTM